MLSRMCGIAELQWTEESSSLPGDKRTVGQRVSKEQCFSFLLQQEEQPSQQWMRAADCSLSHMSHSPRQACAGASAATVGDSALSVVQPSWAATTAWPLSRLTLRPFRRKLQPRQTQPQGTSARGGRQHPQWRKCPPLSGFQGQTVSQPSSTLPPRHRHLGSPLPNPSSEKGEKKYQVSCWAHRRAQHWNKVIYNQEKGRRPLLLEVSSTQHRSINYTNTLCKISHEMCIPVNKIQLYLPLATTQNLSINTAGLLESCLNQQTWLSLFSILKANEDQQTGAQYCDCYQKLCCEDWH